MFLCSSTSLSLRGELFRCFRRGMVETLTKNTTGLMHSMWDADTQSHCGVGQFDVVLWTPGLSDELIPAGLALLCPRPSLSLPVSVPRGPRVWQTADRPSDRQRGLHGDLPPTVSDLDHCLSKSRWVDLTSYSPVTLYVKLLHVSILAFIQFPCLCQICHAICREASLSNLFPLSSRLPCLADIFSGLEL